MKRTLMMNVVCFACASLLASPFVITAGGQSVRRPDKPAPPKSSPERKAPPVEPPDHWRAAQRSLAAAMQQLEEYLSTNPDGERAESARQQLQALRSLTLSAAKPQWVRLYLGAGVAADWRVSSVDPQPERTRLTLEITCPATFNGECGFLSFDNSPLVLLDNNGRYYPMLESGQMPRDVRLVDDTTSVQYRFQPGRVITVEVDFAPLERGALSGHVQYRERNTATPARSSLARQRR